MLRRLGVGFVKGALVGALMALAWERALGGGAFAGAWSYLMAIATGLLTGVLAGKPPWAKGALVEATLKGVAGALVGGAGLYAIDKWVPVSLSLGPLGSGMLGDVAVFALMSIALAIGVVFELDNTEMKVVDDAHARIAPGHARIAGDGAAEVEELHAHEPRVRAARQKH
jgi:hypothetical protein